MPLGTNEIQIVIEFFTTENPDIKISREAKYFIATQKWTSPEILYNSQKEDIDGNGTQWYSAVFIIGLDHVANVINPDWFSDVKKCLNFAEPLADPSGPESTIAVCFRSTPYISETIGFFDDLPLLEDIEKSILNVISGHKRVSQNWFVRFWHKLAGV